MIKRNFYVLSGATGGGKSAVLARLSAFGLHCVAEPARAILAEQRRIKAAGVPKQNADLFSQNLKPTIEIYSVNPQRLRRLRR